MNTSFFITGIGTDVGKTVASAVLAKALGADYWKPVQCGDLANSDSMKVGRLAGCKVHPEAYRLQLPMSPHAAAKAEGVEIDLTYFTLPVSQRPLIVEGAGGILVPLNKRQTMLDLIIHLGIPVILVVRHYLGSINHTLMSLEVLKHRGVSVAGIVYNGEGHWASEDVIRVHAGNIAELRMPRFDELNSSVVAVAADVIRPDLKLLR